MMPCSAALDAEQKIASRLTVPATPAHSQRRFAQSLPKGAAGTALLHIERALRGTGTWQTAHDWLQAATRYDISTADETALFIGAPCINFVLHAACADGTDRYRRSRTQLDNAVTSLAHRRVDAALRRMQRHQLPQFAEYDLFYGLTGLGTLLLHYQPGHDALGRILAYLVRLATEPIRLSDQTMPGWWVHHDPDSLAPTPGGHANFGLAHGISGVLALLALAMRTGITIDRHAEAMEHIGAWMDTWRQEGDSGPWWPQWITEGELRHGQPEPGGPYRPSWCYKLTELNHEFSQFRGVLLV
jgi:lantibiotic biosynthesis protein